MRYFIEFSKDGYLEFWNDEKNYFIESLNHLIKCAEEQGAKEFIVTVSTDEKEINFE